MNLTEANKEDEGMPDTNFWSDNRRVVSGFLPGLLLLALAVTTQAATYTWGVSSGTWNDAANWGGTAPTSSDNAVINNSGTAQLPATVSGTYQDLNIGTSAGGAGTINVTGGVLSGQFGNLGYGSGGQGTATVSGGTWSNDFYLYIGASGTGSLVVSGGNVSSLSAFVGDDQNSLGTVTVSSGTWTTSNQLYLGGAGTGSLTLEGGYIASDTVRIGDGQSGHGTAAVSGGIWNSGGQMFVGNSGTGSLTVSAGSVSASAATLGSNAGSVGTVTVSGGTWSSSSNINVGLSGTGSLTITGGEVSNSSTAFIGRFADGAGTATVSGGTWNSSSELQVGGAGTGSLTISGGNVLSASGVIGNESTGVGTVTVSSGTWSNSDTVFVGNQGSNNDLTVELDGTVTSAAAYIGYGDESNTTRGGNNSAIVSGVGATWASDSNLYIGNLGSGNTLTIESGGVVTSFQSYIGLGSTSNAASGNDNSVTLRGEGSALTNSSNFFVGAQGSGNSLLVEEGGAVSSASTIIGSGGNLNPALGSNNSVTVSGSNSTWINSGSLTVGRYGSNNTLTIEDGALVKVGDAIGETISFSTLGSSEDNFLRLDGGYIALFNDQTAYVGDLLADGLIQLWDGSAWVSAEGSDRVSVEYYTADASGEAAADDATGHSGLGGYTVVTVEAVPEPSTAALLVLGGAALFFRRRKRI